MRVLPSTLKEEKYISFKMIDSARYAISDMMFQNKNISFAAQVKSAK